MRVGKRFSVQCAPFIRSGGELKCVSELKYLGVYLVAAKCFKTSVNHLKVKFYRVFNCIYSFIVALKPLILKWYQSTYLRRTVCFYYCTLPNLFYSVKVSCKI